MRITSFPRFDVRHYCRVGYKHAARAVRLLKSHARLDGVACHVVVLHGCVRARRRINTKMYAPLHACTRVSDILSSLLSSQCHGFFRESWYIILLQHNLLFDEIEPKMHAKIEVRAMEKVIARSVPPLHIFPLSKLSEVLKLVGIAEMRRTRIPFVNKRTRFYCSCTVPSYCRTVIFSTWLFLTISAQNWRPFHFKAGHVWRRRLSNGRHMAERCFNRDFQPKNRVTTRMVIHLNVHYRDANVFPESNIYDDTIEI